MQNNKQAGQFTVDAACAKVVSFLCMPNTPSTCVLGGRVAAYLAYLTTVHFWHDHSGCFHGF
jgi:hypothetical protein